IFLIFFDSVYCEYTKAVWYNAYQIDLQDELSAKKEIEVHINKIADMHFNTIIFLAKDYKGLVYYKSKHAKQACDWDVLDFVIKKSKESKLKVYVYINVFMEGEDFLNSYPEYVELRKNGKPTQWVSPSIPFVRQRMLNIISEIIENYKIDGLQLDRIRYEGFKDIGFNQYSVKLFEEMYKKQPNPDDPDFYQFKCDLISSFVKEASELVKKYNKKYNKTIDFSCAVFATPTNSFKNRISQEWDLWIKNNWLDSIFPMMYTTSLSTFEKYLKENIELIKAAEYNGNFIVGVGAYMKDLDTKVLHQKIKLCFETQEVKGYCIFNFFSINNSKFYDLIKHLNVSQKR
ncbi:MAG: family 10 glycosylhydrolase, partial [Endomicrobia bacterium]|nr:family 10 glycosylhydrolase [Endomicrobiia bacterium]